MTAKKICKMAHKWGIDAMLVNSLVIIHSSSKYVIIEAGKMLLLQNM